MLFKRTISRIALAIAMLGLSSSPVLALEKPDFSLAPSTRTPTYSDYCHVVDSTVLSKIKRETVRQEKLLSLTQPSSLLKKLEWLAPNFFENKVKNAVSTLAMKGADNILAAVGLDAEERQLATPVTGALINAAGNIIVQGSVTAALGEDNPFAKALFANPMTKGNLLSRVLEIQGVNAFVKSYLGDTVTDVITDTLRIASFGYTAVSTAAQLSMMIKNAGKMKEAGYQGGMNPYIAALESINSLAHCTQKVIGQERSTVVDGAVKVFDTANSDANENALPLIGFATQAIVGATEGRAKDAIVNNAAPLVGQLVQSKLLKSNAVKDKVTKYTPYILGTFTVLAAAASLVVALGGNEG